MIIVDIDGTLADCAHRRHLIAGPGPKDWDSYHAACHLDPPIKPLCDLVHTLILAGRELELWSGRTEAVRGLTQQWLRTHCPIAVRADIELLLRPIGDHRTDVELKMGWLDRTLAQGWRIDFVIEDRARMAAAWRRRGILCLQCAEGDY